MIIWILTSNLNGFQQRTADINEGPREANMDAT
jgi:hypothetical protein